MKVFALFAVLACASAKPQYFYGGLPIHGIHYATPNVITYSAPTVTYTATPVVTTAAAAVPVVTKSQYHSQTELGEASYGYAHPGQSHAAFRDAAGNVVGSYAYIGSDGKEVRVSYRADAVNGFTVASNALPVAPTAPEVPALVAPSPVQDTPEVAEARAAHLKAIEEAKVRNAEADKADAAEAEAAPAPEEASSRRKRSVIAYSAHPIVAHVPAVTYAAAAAPVIAAAPAPAVREATLTRVINTPGHAVSYRVD